MRLLSISFALVMTSEFPGCGSRSTPAPVATSAGSPVQPVEQLVGRWQGTMRVNEDVLRAAVSPERVEAAMISLQAMRMQMDFRQDGTLLAGENQGKPYQSQASWELVSQEGSKITLRSIEQGSATGVAPQEKSSTFALRARTHSPCPCKRKLPSWAPSISSGCASGIALAGDSPADS